MTDAATMPMKIDLETTLRLAHAAKAGDRGALSDLFERYEPRVRRIVALRLGKPIHRVAEFDDLVQDTLLRALKGFERFEPRSVGEFRNWLASCAVSAIRDHERGRQAKKRGSGEERRFADLGVEPLSATIFAGSTPSPSKIAIDNERENELELAILQLNERYREAIILRYLCEMSPEEVAETMGFTNTQNARNAYHRALKRLRAILGEDDSAR